MPKFCAQADLERMNLTMKKLIAVMTVLCLCAALLAGCGAASSSAPASEAASGAEATTFTVGFDAAFPPYGYLDCRS